MNAFNGTWKDQNGAVITIEGSANLLTIKYNNGRPPFQGFEVDLTSPVIDVNFTDDRPFVGTLGTNGSHPQIFWNNATVWTKM